MSVTKENREEPLQVSIFNQPYHLRTDGDGDYVRQLARFVDERMQAISSHTSVFDYAKVAVLAALNIADELHRVRLDAERAEAQNLQASSGATGGPERALPQASAGAAEGQERGGDSWSYSDIFESLPSRQDSLPKLGHNIAARLRQLREEASPVPNPEAEE